MYNYEKQIKSYFDTITDFNKYDFAGKKIKLSCRDAIEINNYGINYYLWGTLILWKNEGVKNVIYFNLHGYDNQTTLSRLRIFIPIRKKQGKLFINDIEINKTDVYFYDTKKKKVEKYYL
jgi:hypothetical protein